MSFNEKYNLANNLTDAFYESLQSKKWSDRKDAIEGIVDVMNKNPRITLDDSSFATFIAILSQVC